MLYKYSVTCYADEGDTKSWKQYIVGISYELSDKTLSSLESAIREKTKRNMTVVAYDLLSKEENSQIFSENEKID